MPRVDDIKMMQIGEWPKKHVAVPLIESFEFFEKLEQNGFLENTICKFKGFQKAAKNATAFWNNSDEWKRVMKLVDTFDQVQQETVECFQKGEKNRKNKATAAFREVLLQMTDALFGYEVMKKRELAGRKPDEKTQRKFNVCEIGKEFLRSVGLPEYVSAVEQYVVNMNENEQKKRISVGLKEAFDEVHNKRGEENQRSEDGHNSNIVPAVTNNGNTKKMGMNNIGLSACPPKHRSIQN